MMQLPALTPEERAFLQAGGLNSVVLSLVARLRQRLVANLGIAVAVSEIAGGSAQVMENSAEPRIEIEPALAAAWLSVRLGGAADAKGFVRDAVLIEPLKRLVRCTLAETVVNHGEAIWPQVMRLQVRIGAQQGAVEIHWNGEGAITWARRAIREKT